MSETFTLAIRPRRYAVACCAALALLPLVEAAAYVHPLKADRHAAHVVNVSHAPQPPDGLELPQATGLILT